MARKADWTQGTVSVTINTRIWTGVGTAWKAAALSAGDEIIKNGKTFVIQSVDTNNQITTVELWTDATLTNATYMARFQPDASKNMAAVSTVLDRVEAQIANGRGIFFRFSDIILDSDPLPGNIRLNNADPALTTQIYADNIDGNGADVGAFLDTVDDATSIPHGVLVIRSITNSQNFAAYNFSGAVQVPTGYRRLTLLTYVTGNGLFIDGENLSFSWADRGNVGFTPGFSLAFSTTLTDADPGNGNFRANNATFGSITSLYVDLLDRNNADLTTILDSLDDVQNLTARALIRFQSELDPTKYMAFAVTGVVTTASGYRKIAVTPQTGSIPPNGEKMNFSYYISGADARAAGIKMAYITPITDTDPGIGGVKGNTSSAATVTMLYIDNTDLLGASITTLLDSLDDTVNALGRSTIRLQADQGGTEYLEYTVTGAVVDGTGYRKVPVVYVNGTLPVATRFMSMIITRNGADAKAPGARVTFSTTITDADPGAGNVRFNNATIGSVTQIFVDDVDIGGSTISTFVDMFGDSDNTIKGYLYLTPEGSSQVPAVFSVTGVPVNGTGYRKIPVSYVSGSLPANGIVLGMAFSKSGDDAQAPGFRYQFSTTLTDADPGNGAVRFNNATAASITFIYLDNQDQAANALAIWIDAMGANSNDINKGTIAFQGDGGSNALIEFNVTGTPVDGGGYRKIPVTYIAGAVPANGTFFGVSFARAGSDGQASGNRMIFSVSTIDADPGAGTIRFNSNTFASITQLYIDDLDASGAALGAYVDTWDDASNSASRGTISIKGDGASSAVALFSVTGAVTNGTGYRKVVVTPLSGILPSAAQRVSMLFVRAGTDGLQGFTPGYRLTFISTITDADPGTGGLRANNATFGSITQLFIDNLDMAGTSIINWLDSFDDRGVSAARGYLRFQDAQNPLLFMEFLVTGTVVDATGYRRVTVTPVSGAILASGTVVSSGFNANGANGTNGNNGTNGADGTSGANIVISTFTGNGTVGPYALISTPLNAAGCLVFLEGGFQRNDAYTINLAGPSITFTEVVPTGWRGEVRVCSPLALGAPSVDVIVASMINSADVNNIYAKITGVVGAQAFGKSLATASDARDARDLIYAAAFDAMAYQGLQVNGFQQISQETLGLAGNSAGGVYPVDQEVGATITTGAVVAWSRALAPFPTRPDVPFAVLAEITTADVTVDASDLVYIRSPIEGERLRKLAFGTSLAKAFVYSRLMRANITCRIYISFANQAANRSYLAPIDLVANTDTQVTILVPPDTSGAWVQDSSGSGLTIRIGLMSGSTFQGTALAWQSGNFIAAAAISNFSATVGNKVWLGPWMINAGIQSPDTSELMRCMRNFDEELEICQRYYEKSFDDAAAPAQNTGLLSGAEFFPSLGAIITTVAPIRYKLSKRTTPSITLFNPSAANALARNVSASADTTSATVGNIGTNGARVAVQDGAGGSIGQQLAIHWVANARM